MAEKVGILTGIAEFKLAGIPVGAAATGAAVAGLADGLVSAVLPRIAPQIPPWVVKAGMSWASIQWGPRWLGAVPAQTAGLFLAYDAITDLVNIRGRVGGLVTGVAQKLTAGVASAPASSPSSSPSGNGHGEFASLAEYNKAMGRV